MPWRVRLLGELSAVRGDDRVSRFRSQKTAALFAYLCLHARRDHGREELADLFWPDEAPEAARNNLRVALSSLRKVLEPAPASSGSVLVATRSHIRIRPEAVVTDVTAFETALKAGDVARAVSFYKGPFLPGIYEEWALLERERLEALAEEVRASAQDLPVQAVFPAERDSVAGATESPNNLPVSQDRFFGREEETECLELLLLSPGARLVTLTGPGGVGKTRLSIEVARRLLGARVCNGTGQSERFRGGIWFLSLAALNVPTALAAELPIRLREVLGLPPGSPGGDPLAAISAALEGRSVLFVLDNLEQIADCALIALTPLLERLPQAVFLTTSRVRLGLKGERVIALTPLDIPQPEAEPGELVRSPAVQLFADRARAVEIDFSVTAANAPDVAALVRFLEGSPLALELAAAWANVFSTRQMREQLEGRLLDALPVRRSGIRDPRHHSLAAAFQWSYDLLEPSAARLLAGLSVFRGGCTIEAVSAICVEPRPEAGLARLHQYSLLTSRAAPDGGEIRFQLPESLRTFAESQLSDAEQDELERHHIAYFLDLAEEQNRQQGTPGSAAALDRLQREYDNLSIALARASALVDCADKAMRLATAQQWLWRMRGPVSEGRRLLTGTLALPGAQTPTLERADALNALGSMAYLQADFTEMRDRFTESLILCRSLNYEKGALAALGNLGVVRMDGGDFAGAVPIFEEALAIARSLGERGKEAIVLYNLGNLAHWQRDLLSARQRHEEALAIRRPLGDSRGVALSETSLGILAMEGGEFDRAGEHFRAALGLQRQIGDRFGAVNSLDNLARAIEGQGNDREAAGLRGASDALRDALQTPLPPNRREVWDTENAALRVRLGDAAFDTQYEIGFRLGFEDAVARALGEPERED